MKAGVFSISDFPFFGKKALPDERLQKIQELYRSQKVTSIQVEFVTEKDLKIADVLVCPADKKLDLMILDLEVIEAKSERPAGEEERALLKRCQGFLEKEVPLSQGDFSEEERKWLANNNFVTSRPVVFVTKEEAGDLPALAKRVYGEAGRIVFLTGGPKEARAWEIRKGANAVDAAGCIHSDIARGFIKAEVMAYDDLVKAGNVHQAKASHLRQEDKDYIVKDGDVIEFKFNV